MKNIFILLSHTTKKSRLAGAKRENIMLYFMDFILLLQYKPIYRPY